MTQDQEKPTGETTMDTPKQLADLRGQQLPALEKRIGRIFSDMDTELVAATAEPQEPQELAPTILSDPASEPVPDATVVAIQEPTPAEPVAVEKKLSARKQLFADVQDGEAFTLQDNKGKNIGKYRRQGKKVIQGDNESKDDIANVLKVLNKGGKCIPENASVVAGVPSVTPEPTPAVVLDPVADPVVTNVPLVTPAAPPQEPVPNADAVVKLEPKSQRRAKKRDPMPVEADDVRLAREAKEKEEKDAKDLENERLLATIPEGAFVLTNPNDPSAPGEKYKREGDKIIDEDKRRKNVTGDVLGKMREKGWTATGEVKPIKRTVDQPATIAEKEPIQIGKYRDEDGFLCEVVKDGDEYTYTVLEGPDKGQLGGKENAGNFRILIKDWKKVDDTTAPAADVITDSTPATPDVTFDVSKEKIKLPENPSEILFYETPNGKIAVEFDVVTGMYKFAPVPEDARLTHDEILVGLEWGLATAEEKIKDEILVMAKDQNWKQIDAPAPVPPVMPPAPAVSPVAPADTPPVDRPVDAPAAPLVNPDQSASRREPLPTTTDIPTNIPTLTDVLETPKPERADTALGESLLAVGEKAQYFVPKSKSEYTVERTAEGYHFFDKTYDSGFITEEEMRKEIRSGKWERTKTQEEKEQEKGVATSQELLDKIAGLETLVEEERSRYAEADYRKKSILGRLRALLPGLSEGQPDSDSEFWRIQYTKTLTDLQNAQLERIKLSGVSGDALKQEMAGLLQYYKVNEVVELYQARTQVRLETKKEGKRSWEGVMDAIENFGRSYNKMAWQKKLLIAGAVFGSAAFLAATGGAAGGAAGVAIVGIRKLVTSVSGGVALDAFFEGAGKFVGGKLDQREIDEQMESLEKHLASGSTMGKEEYVKNMEALLSGELQNIEAKFQKKKWRGKVRKLAAFTASTGLSFASYAFQDASGASTPGADAFNNAAQAAAPASAPDLAASAPGRAGNTIADVARSLKNLEELGKQGVGFASGQVEGALPPPPGAPLSDVPISDPVSLTGAQAIERAAGIPPDTMVETSGVATLREAYAVTAADGKKGLWGILDKRLPNNIPEGAGRNRAIQSLENAMRAKLDSWSPAERVAAGFPKSLENGKVNLDFIRVNDKIDFQKLLTAQEIQDVIDGKSIASPSVAQMASGAGTSVAGIPDVVSLTEKAEILRDFQETTSRVPDVVSLDEKAEILKGFEGSNRVAENIALSDPRAYLSAHPEQMSVFNNTLGKVQSDIFALNSSEVGVPKEYDFSVNGEKLGATKVSDVLKNLKGFESGRLGYNRDLNPLHYDQMKALQKFVAVAEKTFGSEVAQVEAGESISHYTERMTTASLKTGRNIADFWKDSVQPTAEMTQVVEQPNPVTANEAATPVSRGMPVTPDNAVIRPESVVAANEVTNQDVRELALFRQACVQNIGALRHDILLTPPPGTTSMAENFHLAKYDYASNPSLGRINVQRVLEASWELQNGTGARSPMNWAKYPLHPAQIESVVRAIMVAQDPRILGVWGAPTAEETIDKYTARIGVALTKANKVQMFSALLNGRGIRLAA